MAPKTTVFSTIPSALCNVKTCLVKEAQEPKGNLIALATALFGAGVEDIIQTAARHIHTHTEATAIHQERGKAVTHAHVMVGPKCILEKSLIDIDGLHAVGVDGIHQAAVVHHYARRLLGECLVRMVDEVDETCVGEIFDVVHHGSARGLNLVGKLADVGCRGPFNGKEIEEFLQLRQVFELYLLDEQDIHL